MSLLMFRQMDDEFLVLTDTLAATADGEPFAFQSKVRWLPELRLVIAAPGVSSVAEAWYRHIREGSVIARDIDSLNDSAQEILCAEWEVLRAGQPPPAQRLTTTIYHFGITDVGHAARYRYDSRSNFLPERRDDECFAIKPEPDELPSEWPNSVSEFVELAVRVRRDCDRKPPPDRIRIGGELILTALTAGGVQCVPVHRFEDYEAMWERMVSQRTIAG